MALLKIARRFTLRLYTRFTTTEAVVRPFCRLAALSAIALLVFAQVGGGGNATSAANGTTTGTTVTPLTMTIN